MTITQYLRILWARRWSFASLVLLVSGIGAIYTLMQPPRYEAAVTMLIDVKLDPILGAMAPGLAQPGFMATQVEMIQGDRVAGRAVQILGVDKSEDARRRWMEATQGKTPIESYYGAQLLRGLTVEPSLGSNFIGLAYAAPDAKFAAATANAFAQAYLDVALEMRVQPARQYATWFDEQSKVLRGDLERAQAKLSTYQQEKGITDERLEQETARLTILMAQQAAAQAEQAEATSRLQVSGGEMSPDVQQSGAVQSLKTQLVMAQSKLTEISGVVGTQHPQRLALEAQIAQLRGQIAVEMRRVSGSTSAASKASARKLVELQELVEQQKARVLTLRSARDDIQVLVKDVENAQHAYEGARSRLSQLNLESQTNQHNVRVMTPAIEPLAPSTRKTVKMLLVSLIAGLAVGVAVTLGRELLDRRVRAPDDMLAVDGVPVLGVLGPPGSRQPVYRRLAYGGPLPTMRALPGAGANP